MKKILLPLCALLAALSGTAQTGTPFNAAEYIDISNIRARHMVHGDMWWNPATGLPACEFPKGSGKNVSFASALWIAGYDPQHALHVSAQTYRQNGNDYWPGPLDPATNSTTYAQEADWAQIWKVNRSTIDSFRMMFAMGLPFLPDVINGWPAKGNVNAKGTSGGYLDIVANSGRDYAPFVDVNMDGMYNAYDGDYPAIKGDQMLWWVVNDAGTTHNASGGAPLNIEIHHSAYAYHRGGALDNVIFYEYKVINRSTSLYDSLRVGLWADVELGNGFDDFIGYDSSRRMGICYNGTPTDGVYGSSLPIMGIAMMELPSDSAGTYAPAGSFSYYKNSAAGPYANPQGPNDYNNLLSARFTTGNSFPNNGRYALSRSQQCDSNAVPDDQRFIISAKSRSLDGSGVMLKVGMALIVCPNAGGCPGMSFSCLDATADTAFTVYHHPLPATGIEDVRSNRALHLYPNPSTDHLFFQSSDGRNAGSVIVYDAAGKSVPVGIKRSITGLELDVRALQPGQYHVVYSCTNGREGGTFVKR